MSDIGELRPLKRKNKQQSKLILQLQEKIARRDNKIKTMETPSQHYENKMHDIRTICKDPKLPCCSNCCEKVNNIYTTTLK